MNNIYQSVKPARTILPKFISTSSGHVQKQQLVEFRPENTSTFSYSTNNEMIINIDSPSDLFLPDDSYLRAEITATAQYGGVDAGERYLSEGGVQSVARDIILETQNGVEIARMPRYNKFYATMSQVYHSREHINSCLGREGDSAECVYDEMGGEFNYYQRLSGTVTVGAAGAVTGDGTLALNELNVGDLFFVTTNAGGGKSYHATVTAITDDEDFTLSTAVEAAEGSLIYKLSLPSTPNKAIRNVALTTNNNGKGYIFTLQLALNEFKSIKAFPLFLLKGGLRVRIILERPAYVMALPVDVSDEKLSISNVDYTIKNPVFMASMMTPSPVLMKHYYDMYNAGGIHFHSLGVLHTLETLEGSAQTRVITMNPNKRSAKFIFGKIQNLRAETETALSGVNPGKSTFTCDSVAQGLRAGLRNYIFEVGTLRFPLNKPVDLENDISHSEAMVELQRVKDDLGSYISGKRFRPIDFQNRVNRLRPYESTQLADAQRLVISANLCRDRTPMAGIDISLNNLRFIGDFDQYEISDLDGEEAAQSTRYVHLWLLYDKLITLQKDSGLVVRA